MTEEHLQWCEDRMAAGKRIENLTIRQLITAIREGRTQSAVDEPMPRVSTALEAKRRELGLTKMAFADRLGLQRSHYTEIIKGLRCLSMRASGEAFKLGIPPEVLFQIKPQVLGGQS